MRLIRRSFGPLLALLFVALTVEPGLAAAPAADPLPAIKEKVAGLEKHDGLLSFYLDRQRGNVWLVMPPARDGEE